MSLDSIIFGETAGLRLEMTRNACASCGSHHYVENGQIKPTRKCAEFVYPLEAVVSAHRAAGSQVMSFILACLLTMAGLPARAQDPFSWAGKHASIVSGSFVTESGPRSDFVGLRIVDEFKLTSKLTGFVRVDLFSRARDGQITPPPTIPTSLEALQAYSDGELYLGAYHRLNERLAAQCVGGVFVAMPSISGKVGDPLDGTKFMGACGLRVASGDAHVSLMGGHVGPVIEGDHFAGLIPSMILEAYLPVLWMGEGFALTPDLSVGRDIRQKRSVYSARLAISKHFGR